MSDSDKEQYEIIEKDSDMPSNDNPATIDPSPPSASPPAPSPIPSNSDHSSPILQVLPPPQLSPWGPINPSEWTSITDDGHVYKSLLPSSPSIAALAASSSPDSSSSSSSSISSTSLPSVVPILSRVYCLFKGYLDTPSFPIYIDSEGEEIDFCLGQAQQPRGVELAVCGLRVGDHARLFMKNSNGFSSTRRPSNVPKDAGLWIDLVITRWEKEKNLHEMNGEEKLNFIEMRRSIGKKLYEKKRYQSAINQYKKGIQVLEQAPDEQLIGLNKLKWTKNIDKIAEKYQGNIEWQKEKEEEEGQGKEGGGGEGENDDQDDIQEMDGIEMKKQLAYTMYLNIAACYMKLSRYDSVIEFCNKALPYSPSPSLPDPKLVYRRAIAHKYRDEWDQAIKDFQFIINHPAPKGKENNIANNNNGKNEEKSDNNNNDNNNHNNITSNKKLEDAIKKFDQLKLICHKEIAACEKKRSFHGMIEKAKFDKLLQKKGGKLLGDLYDDKPDKSINNGDDNQLLKGLQMTNDPFDSISRWTKKILSGIAAIPTFVRQWCNKSKSKKD